MYSLIGVDGNAFAIMGYVWSVMKHEGYSQEEIDDYLEEAKDGDYDHLVLVSQKMLDKINSKKGE